ncbi:MAG: ATP-binding protein [Clostridium sp.]|nr:ATP-binding protein [Clostridium sp.]
MVTSPKYPVGEQSFSSLIEENYLYVDKTRFIEKILSEGKYYFLGRPRRFGKSLFLSTLKCFFEGRRDLFRGLYIDSIDWDWKPYPVFHISLNTMDYTTPGKLEAIFDSYLSEWERDFDATMSIGTDISIRFRNVIKRAWEVTGRKVVILVDEYDNPLVDSLGNRELYDEYRNQLSAIYSNFKSSADYLRLVFLTGVSRFGKVSVFSGLNNLRDISFDNEFAEICGITEEEIDTYFYEGLSALAKTDAISYDQARDELKRQYDGYHFSSSLVDIYNPFSFLSALAAREIKNYWIMSGRTEFVSRQIVRNHLDIEKFLNSRCSYEALSGIEPHSPNPVALLYQTGYLTIKDYNRRSRIFTLGLPNTEVKQGLIDSLLPCYTSLIEHESPILVDSMTTDLESGDAEGFMKKLGALLAGYSYEMKLENENNFHNVIYMLTLLLGVNVETEHRTSDGRIDLLITTEKYRYVIELKVDSSPEEALRQIDRKDYPLQFSTEGCRLIRIGANFSTKTRRMTGYLID